MSNWKVIDQDPSVLELYAELMTFGLGKHRYIVENTETGERRVIFADDPNDLGQKIGSGDFDKDQWPEQRPPREKKERADRKSEGMGIASHAQSTGTRRSRGRSRSSGPDDDRPGCWGCLMASLGGAAICIVVMVTGFGPPFFDHLMLIFFAFCALVSHMGCKLQASTTSKKIVFGISVVVGLVCWRLIVEPFSVWLAGSIYPPPISPENERFVKSLAPFWVCLISPTLAVFAVWCFTSLMVRLGGNR